MGRRNYNNDETVAVEEQNDGQTAIEVPETQTGESVPDDAATDAAEDAKDTDRGNIGVVRIETDEEEWTPTRTRTSTNPVHIAVRDAEIGKPYKVSVENDPTKIARVRRMLRAAAQNYGVSMNIHPEHKADPTNEANVFVRFRTQPRDPATDAANETNTENGTGETPAE